MHDAEDALQESLLRAWQALPRLETPQNLRGWLYRIATNRCLTLAEGRRRRALPTAHAAESVPATEVAWLEPYPEPEATAASAEDAVVAGERLELAFVAVLQELTPVQRAALLLREGLGFSAKEVAAMLDTTPAAVNSALQRARGVVGNRAGEASPRPAPTAAAAQRLAREYAAAWGSADVEAIVAMLSEDARYSMPPLPRWYAGRAAIRGFLQKVVQPGAWRFLPTRANGTLAFGTYLWSEEDGAFKAAAIDLLELSGEQVLEVVSFLQPSLFELFALPAQLPATEPR